MKDTSTTSKYSPPKERQICRFTFRCSPTDLASLSQIANHLRRNESDTIRWLIYEKLSDIAIVTPEDTATGRAE